MPSVIKLQSASKSTSPFGHLSRSSGTPSCFSHPTVRGRPICCTSPSTRNTLLLWLRSGPRACHREASPVRGLLLITTWGERYRSLFLQSLQTFLRFLLFSPNKKDFNPKDKLAIYTRFSWSQTTNFVLFFSQFHSYPQSTDFIFIPWGRKIWLGIQTNLLFMPESWLLMKL